MPDTLSGGQKQRITIARALAIHPDMMLFDELICPVLCSVSGASATVRLICSETSTRHILMASFRGVNGSPLSMLDTLNITLLNAACISVMETQNEDGWEIIMQL